jgi:hypothetical protein
MRRLLPNSTLEEEEVFIESHRNKQFLMAFRWTNGWLSRAHKHKLSADILYDIAYEANERNMVRSMASIDNRGTGESSSRVLEGEELRDAELSDLYSEYLLLAGYALECMLKGYLLGLRPDLVTETHGLHRSVATHDLCKLCEKCELSLSDKEKELLALIKRYVEWGKYAAPRHTRDMPSAAEGDQRNKSLGVANPFHERRIQKIVDGVFLRITNLLAAQRTQ